MTATNHILTGALIGATVSNPFVAIPLALLSHVLLDALPHFGRAGKVTVLRVLLIDALLSSLVFSALVFSDHYQHWLIVLCGVVAFAPDILWLRFFIPELKGQKVPRKNRLEHFLSIIQWGERPWGLWIEVPFGLGAATVLFTTL